MEMMNRAIEDHAAARDFLRKLEDKSPQGGHTFYTPDHAMSRQDRRAEAKAIRAENRRANQSNKKASAK